ncbi:MAG: hypothetical protein HY744_07345 [Deltaproteobacteria bacterium]|nr:hypothetical protein [Deltaproteobacteria bacterium]
MASTSCDRAARYPRHAGSYPPPSYPPARGYGYPGAPPPASGYGYPGAPPQTPPSNPLVDLLGQLLGSGPAMPGQIPWPMTLPWPSWPPPVPWPSQPPPGPGPAPQPVPPTISPRAVDLANTIDQYRQQNGLPAVPLSRALTHVAETHVRDLRDSPSRPGCNAHSWTDRGPWTPCCYTPDHAQAQCMWGKPSELTQFKATGFEIAIGRPGEATGYVLDSQRSLDLWKSSAPHHDVILNRGTWQTATWRALGTGIIDSHAAAWFAEEADPMP